MPRPIKKPGTARINMKADELEKDMNTFINQSDKQVIRFLILKIAELELTINAISKEE